MKAIIINDTDARALLDSLELTALRNDGHYRGHDDPPPTPEQIRLSKQIVAKIRGVGRNLSGEGNDDWAKRLKARAIAGEQLQPCQLRAMREALADEPPTADELEAIQERAAIMAEGA